MAITVDQAEAGTGSAGNGAASVAATLGANIAANGLVVVVVGWWTGTGTTLGSITDNGPGLTYTIHQQGGPFSVKCAIATAPDTGGDLDSGEVVTATFSGGTASGAAIGVSSLLGADLTGSRIETSVTPNDDEADANWACDAMTVSAGSAIVATAFNESGVNTGGGTSYTPLVDHQDNFNNGLRSVLRIPGAGSFDAGGSWGSTINAVTTGIAILEGAAAASGAGGGRVGRPGRHRGRFPARDAAWFQ